MVKTETNPERVTFLESDKVHVNIFHLVQAGEILNNISVEDFGGHNSFPRWDQGDLARL